jgi:hypothetical protein
MCRAGGIHCLVEAKCPLQGEFSESIRIQHTDLEQQVQNAVSSRKIPSLRAKRGSPSPRTSTMGGLASLAMTGDLLIKGV